MTRTIRIAIAAAVVFGAATVALAGSPEGINAISPSVPLQGMARTATGSRTDVHARPYALTGQPAPNPESTEWRWVSQNYGGKVIQVIPQR
jgi:hypothetical protein